MAGRRGCDFAGNAAEPLLDELAQRPAGTVAGQHGKIVKMNVCVSVRVCDFVVIDFGEPVIRGNCAGVGKNQSPDGIGDGGIFLDAPVCGFDVFIDELLVVEHCGFHVAQLFALSAVKDISLCNVRIICLDEDGLDAVLNILDGNQSVFDFRLEIRCYLESEKIDGIGIVIPITRFKCLRDGMTDFG